MCVQQWRPLHIHRHDAFVGACVCVCVCVRERERERVCVLFIGTQFSNLYIAVEYTHTHKRIQTHMRMDMQWAPLLYTHCSPLTRTPSFSSADDPVTRCGALGLRGGMATPMRQGSEVGHVPVDVRSD